ncbi:sensor histidine kinase [Nocardiopsis composta]|uniref:histidine kinase n=1 Tax=Nocardiopsis composta TaxID=157465 RepID=A0A7W8VFS4_9ACTN|nr:HAMP domain-containing sensor histidine kinase [Nocardiopsis composta]MBB5434259.1 two-component system OmpR family sensor kinase [Nocardiopsis composta]
MPPGRLRSRLLIGLLAVTAVGLLVTCVVGFVTMRGFITDRIDDQVTLAAESAMVRLDNDTPPVGVEAPSPSPYLVVLMDGRTGKVTQIYGDLERDDVALERIAEVPLRRMHDRAGTQEIFDLDGRDATVPPFRATVRPRPNGLMITLVPTNEREEYPWQLVLTQLVTAVLLLGGLALAGRWLIVRGLEPLDRMATTADRISTGSDLSARMPATEKNSEVGRLAGAINTMLARLEQAFAAQRESEERVRAFAADASHELRTPLTTIRGYAELYRQGAVPEEELGGAMRRIEDEAERMSRLVGELLELARLDRGGSLHLETTDLVPVVREMVADARVVAPDREVSLEAPDRLPCRIDEARFRQVLANLLANTAEHTPPGTPVRVRLTAGPAHAALEVSDEGPGMSGEDLRRAFDRFHRGTRSPGGGSGLGLSIVAAIADAHGGDSGIASAPGAGTRVTVRFPYR